MGYRGGERKEAENGKGDGIQATLFKSARRKKGDNELVGAGWGLGGTEDGEAWGLGRPLRRQRKKKSFSKRKSKKVSKNKAKRKKRNFVN